MFLFDYYKTEWWIKRSREFRRGKTCVRCGTDRGLHTHHKRYRFYREKDSDLEVLCKNCHLREVHKQKNEDDLLDFSLLAEFGGNMSLDLNHIGPTNRLSLLIDRALESQEDLPRTYLGASRLGEECSRSLQFEFFGTPKDKTFPGKTLRTFEIGKALEELMVKWLQVAGVIVSGRQASFSTANGLIRGHCDGVLTGGPEDFGPFPRLWECKTASSKKWKEFEKHHIKKASPVYYAQVQMYMTYLNLQSPALFTVINKDDSSLYFEDVPFDPETAQEVSDKGARIIQSCMAKELLPRVSEDPEYFLCKWCAWGKRCHTISTV